MYYNEKLKSFAVCIICAVVLLCCSSIDLGRKFTPVESGFMLEPGKSIAVISGHNDDNDIQLAEMIIEELSKTGKFNVLSQSDLKRLIPRYPLNLDLIDFSVAGNKDKRFTPYLSSTSKEAIDTVQGLVKTDYILVVWIDDMQTSSVSIYQGGTKTTRWMCIMSRLLAYPDGNVAGYSARWNEDSSIFGDWEDFFNEASENLVKEIIKKTKK